VMQHSLGVHEVPRAIGHRQLGDAGLLESHVAPIRKIPARHIERFDARVPANQFANALRNEARPPSTAAPNLHTAGARRQGAHGKNVKVARENIGKFGPYRTALIIAGSFPAEIDDHLQVDVVSHAHAARA
jgi:hypothetical protein